MGLWENITGTSKLSQSSLNVLNKARRKQQEVNEAKQAENARGLDAQAAVQAFGSNFTPPENSPLGSTLFSRKYPPRRTVGGKRKTNRRSSRRSTRRQVRGRRS